MAEMTMVQAINLALHQEMENDDTVMVLGEDVGVDGGVFRVTEGLIDTFGKDRVMDTPLAESAIIGISIGMAVYGLKPVCETQFSGFSYMGFHQLESHASRLRARSCGRFNVQMVLRTPYGAGVRALEHHSESRECYYAHTPGIKVVIPSSPRKARSLLVAAIRDADPVVFYEPKALYRAFREEVPDEEETFSLGRSEVVREGKHLTMITYGAMLHPCLEAASMLQEKDGIETEVIDLLTISPMDDEFFCDSVRKTGHVLVVHEAPRSFGPGSEIVSRLIEKSFLYLEAPIRRVTGFDVHVPLFQRERDYLPGAERIFRAAREILEF
ncbi:MAG: alpha-ketoacid dehydrogenase subunit beta [Desulfobacterales bacterium]